MKTDKLVDLLPLDLQARVKAGELIIEPGQNPAKPVLKDAETKRFIKGSGRPVKANDPVVVGKATGYKRTRSFQEWFDSFIPTIREDNPDAIVSLEELIELAAKAVRGEDVKVTCPSCHIPFFAPIKPNGKLLEFLIERRVGRAKETTDINIRSESLVKLLQDSTPINVIEVMEISPEERKQRMALLTDGQ